MFSSSRYFEKTWHNDNTGLWSVSTHSSYHYVDTTMSPRVSFATLIEMLRDAQPNSQSLKNRLTAVRQLVRIGGRTMLDCAYADLVTAVEQTLRSIDACTELSASRRRDLRSHARWLSAYLSKDATSPRQVNRPAPRPDSAFTQGLRDAFHASGLMKSQVARAAEMSPATFGEWLMGRQPRVETLAKLPLVECVLGLADGALSQHIARARAADISDPCLAYRQGVRECLHNPTARVHGDAMIRLST